MIISANIEEKTMGSKLLLKNFSLSLQENQKIAIIGRNGVGKSTLLGLLDGSDDEYIGEINLKKGVVVMSTRQEHNEVGDMTVLEYILSELPQYTHLKKIIENFEHVNKPNRALLGEFSDAIERFGVLDYYRAEDKVIQELERYQIDIKAAKSSLKNLSGGQKRFVELVKIAESHVDLALIDEPTNHMDYVAKAEFITWLNECKCAVVLVSHDRDVLAEVDAIVEIKDHQAYITPGGYDKYLQQNSHNTIQGIGQYEIQLKTLDNLKKQLASAQQKKLRCKQHPNPFVPLVRRFEKQIAELEAKLDKPSFWIDQDSIQNQQKKIIDKYDKYKSRNINVKTDQFKKNYQELMQISDLSLGYTKPLFENVSIIISTGDRVELRGRNGAGKSTLVKAILDTSNGINLQCNNYDGFIEPNTNLKVGYYEQEITTDVLGMTLSEAIQQVYRLANKPINLERINSLAHQYLFEPDRDLQLKLRNLSGGQKARFQLIKMLCGEPNLLILDEPTNHLDLPSIEELEKALISYTGAILYVSHDNYFRDKLKGEIINL
jgi:ATPase subunit of ABC transporter with duplicated ATPase domains